MNRKEFIAAAASAVGACACGGAALAQSSEAGQPSPETKELKRKVEFMQKRMALLVAALDAPIRKKVLETLGRQCAKEFSPLLERFRGKPEAFLAEAKRQWVKTASFDVETGNIRIVDRSTRCTCAFVQPGLTPADFCSCTLGWQKEAYSTILNQPADAEVESSILHGASQCSFRIWTQTKPS